MDDLQHVYTKWICQAAIYSAWVPAAEAAGCPCLERGGFQRFGSGSATSSSQTIRSPCRLLGYPGRSGPVVRKFEGRRQLAILNWVMPTSPKVMFHATEKRAQKLEAKGKPVDFDDLRRGARTIRDWVPDWEVYGFLTTDPNAVVAPIHSKAMPVIHA